jgi:hypothetical protein
MKGRQNRSRESHEAQWDNQDGHRIGVTYNGGILGQFAILEELMDGGLKARTLMLGQREVLEVEYKSLNPVHGV